MLSEKRNAEVAVIGAGIVGLASAYALVKMGFSVTVVDRDPKGDKASFGNASGIAVTEIVPASSPGVFWKVPGWLLDSLGPLSVRWPHVPHLLPWLIRFAAASRASEMARIAAALSQLNTRTYDDLRPLLKDCSLTDEMNEVGALSVYKTQAGLDGDRKEWDLRREHNIDCQEITGNEARDLEPALSPSVAAAVLMPQWSHFNDPKYVVDRLRDWLITRQVQIVTSNATSISATADKVEIDLESGARLNAAHVVVAAGAWSRSLARTVGDPVLLESERGYNKTLSNPGVSVGREIVFAEDKFVATPLSGGLRIGGAAEFGGLEAKPNYKRAHRLAQLAKNYFPDLRTDEGDVWAGHRPATPDSLPVIGRSPRSHRVVYAFGHGHLGLTQAATTGRIVCDLIAGQDPGLDISPYAITRFSRS